ncbi:hypothetical protein SDC9_44347 [bioreactor metagenome]|uniref:DUF4007 domain-containing protein n=1 Tax=bioreactor metagenome TaxID=1076179 RepID=A0A644W3H4_9ZZZZ
MIKMKFRGHETFFVRKGWLNKGLKYVSKDPLVFMGTNGNPMDILGIGSNMVKSLRYWLQAFTLTVEPTSGKRDQHLTSFGQDVFKNDPYLEEIGTLCLLHYRLVTNSDDATAWYYFFNEFRPTEYNRDDFVLQLSNYLRLNGVDVSERSLEDDYNCIISTYVPRAKSNPEKVRAESNIDCPLGELGLVDIANKKNKTYKKSEIKKDLLPPLIALAIILEQSNGNKEVKISAIQGDANNIGKVFNISIISLTSLLYKLELMGYIKVIRTAGLDVINIITMMSFEDCVLAYYQSLEQ